MKMKIIFFDKDKELCKLAKSIPELEVKNCDLSKIEADAVSTASNPDFTFGGGIDATLKKRFKLKKGNWLNIQKGDKKIKNVVLNITVNSDLSSNKELVRRAYINFFNLAKNKKWNKIAISGFGSGVGNLPKTTVIEALREAVDMYLTIISEGIIKKNVELIDIQNLRLDDIRSAKMTDCKYATMKDCWGAKMTDCKFATMTDCEFATMTNCWRATMTDCKFATMKDCWRATMTDCKSATMKDCWGAKMTDCESPKMTDCKYAKMTDCESATMTDCESATMTDCEFATMTDCWRATMTDCESPKMTDCKYAKMTDCESATMTDCKFATMTDCKSATMKDCWGAKMTDCKFATMTDCWSVILLYSSGQADSCYISDKHKSDFVITNPLKKSDYGEWFLLKLKKGKKCIAYKYLTKNWESPISTTKIQYKKGKIYKNKIDKNVQKDCSYGINLATLRWCKANKGNDSIIVKFEFSSKNAVVPRDSNGKFRVSKAKCIGIL